MKRSSAFLCTVSLSLFVTASPAMAAGAATDKASAEALFNDGIALVASGDYALACSKFEGSQALDPTLGTELRLADCFERLGRNASAWALFKECQGLAHVQGQREREELAQERADALFNKLSYLVIQLEGEPPAGLALKRNDRAVPLASLGGKIPVDPGKQTIVASAPSYLSWSGSVDVPAETGLVSLKVPALTRAPAPRAAAPAPVPDGRSTQRTAGVVVGAVGLLSVLSGGALGLYAKHENDRSKLDQYCPTDGHNGCTSDGLAMRERAQSYAQAATATWLVGGALLATGVVLWSTAPRRTEPATLANVRLSANVSLASCQAQLGAAW